MLIKKKTKKVYLAFSSDIFVGPYYKILKKASKLGSLTVGLLTDEAISKYRTIPHLTYEQRYNQIKKFKFIKKIIPQDDPDYSNNLTLLKPDYVVHGDDWIEGIQKKYRQKVIKILKKWKGKLIEYPYDKTFSNEKLNYFNLSNGTTPVHRQSKLKRLLKIKKIIKVLEAHNPISALIVEKMSIDKKNKFDEFDAIWSSSLTDSVSRGKPDNQSVDYSTRLSGLNEILDVTTKPVIFDADNGGRLEHLKFMVKSLDRMGISAIVMEDKVGLKKNSLFQNQTGSQQDTINNFTKKIKICCENRFSENFLVIARIESIVLGKGVDHAIKRAISYSKAGADMIFISNKDTNPKKVFEFSKKFRKSKYSKPLVAVPSTYSSVKEKELIKNNINLVIYANHLLRASYKSMVNTAGEILLNQRALESEKNILPIKKIISLIND